MRGQRGSCAGWSGRSGHAGGKNEVALRVVDGIFQRALLRQVGGSGCGVFGRGRPVEVRRNIVFFRSYLSPEHTSFRNIRCSSGPFRFCKAQNTG